MKLIKNRQLNWQEKQGYSKKVLMNLDELSGTPDLLQQIKIRPGEVVKPHHHNIQTEIFYFNEINGEFIVNGEGVVLQPDDILVIEPGDIHEVRNHSSKDFIYLCLKINSEESDLIWD